MRPEVKKLLFDVQAASLGIQMFVDGKTVDDLNNDLLLRSGVERQFEIIGEALNRLSKIAAEIAEQITDYQKIISFRNVLIHGYDNIDQSVTWRIICEDLPVLQIDLKRLLNDAAG